MTFVGFSRHAANVCTDAKRSIHILDWWLSPELYLRRPPAANEQYRLDVMLKSAAERGVKVNIIVYREVSAALSLNSSVCLCPLPLVLVSRY